jgi:TonB family protein
LHPIQETADTLQHFPYTAALVALSPEKMGILLSQASSSEAGFLTTTDGGKTWSFSAPPGTGIVSFLKVDDGYWASGHEVADKDKPGGGHSVPVAMRSADGRSWQRTTNDIHMCQAQTCGVCKTAGCLASDSLVVNFYGAQTTYLPIPRGALTQKWAAVGLHLCSVGNALFCTTAAKATADLSAPGGPRPDEQIPPALNAKPAAPSVLTCVLCGFKSIFQDDKLQGQVSVPVTFTVETDGTVRDVEVKNISSPHLQKEVHEQIAQWLFEPPVQNGKPFRVTTNSTLNITVMRTQ